MYAILISPKSSLPTIVSQQSLDYAELMAAGYQVTQTGTKRQLEALEEEIMQDYVCELELNN